MALENDVQRLMMHNRREVDGYTYTVPSPDIYPFQWLWDSCFHSIILSYFDIEAAKAELRSAFSHPLPSGLLPHIIYWQKSGDEFNWGREFRGPAIMDAFGTAKTSSITQPPVQAMALKRLYDIDGDRSLLKELYPTLQRHFQYLANERTFEENSLVYLINPDESGEDNSPRFDTAQGLPHHHTAELNLEKRMLRMRQNQECDFEAQTCMSRNFAIADSTFNILYLLDLQYMEKIAGILRKKNDKDWFSNEAKKVKQSIKDFLMHDNLIRSHDHLAQRSITSLTWSIFIPLLTDILSQKEADALIEEYYLQEDRFGSSYQLPTTALSESSFDAQAGFWRGPVWIGANWFIYQGLKNYGYDDLAAKLRSDSLKLLEKNGFREQFHPRDGVGQGASNFTWGGLILDMN